MLKKLFKRLLLLFAVLLVVAVVGILLLPYAGFDPNVVKAVVDPAESAFGDKRKLHILLLGVDYNYDSKAQRYTKGARSDTILLLRVEPLGKELSMMSIPRDLMVGIGKNAIHGYDRINAAYSYGGEKLAIETVEQITGLEIDHHIVVKSDIVEELVDGIGGVPINVEKQMDWDDNWAGLHIHLKPGEQVLSGTDAVGYCRFRRDAEGDFGRIKRQQKFLGALLKKLKATSKFEYPKLAKIVRAKLKTDLTDEQLAGLGLIYRKFPLDNIRKGRPEVEDYFANGSAYLILAPGEPKQIVQKLFPPLPDPEVRKLRIVIKAGPTYHEQAKLVSSALKERGFGRVKTRLLASDSSGETTLHSYGIKGKALEILRDTFPELKVKKKKKKDHAEAVLTLRSDVSLSENL